MPGQNVATFTTLLMACLMTKAHLGTRTRWAKIVHMSVMLEMGGGGDAVSIDGLQRIEGDTAYSVSG